MDGNGFDWCQMREARKQSSHSPVALSRLCNFFVPTEGDSAAPVEFVLDVVSLKTYALILTHRAGLSPRQRVNIDVVAVNDVADWNYIRPVIGHAAKPSDATLS